MRLVQFQWHLIPALCLVFSRVAWAICHSLVGPGLSFDGLPHSISVNDYSGGIEYHFNLKGMSDADISASLQTLITQFEHPVIRESDQFQNELEVRVRYLKQKEDIKLSDLLPAKMRALLNLNFTGRVVDSSVVALEEAIKAGRAAAGLASWQFTAPINPYLCTNCWSTLLDLLVHFQHPKNIHLAVDDKGFLGVMTEPSLSVSLGRGELDPNHLNSYDYIFIYEPNSDAVMHVALYLGYGLIYEKTGLAEIDYYRISTIDQMFEFYESSMPGQFIRSRDVDYRRPINWTSWPSVPDILKTWRSDEGLQWLNKAASGEWKPGDSHFSEKLPAHLWEDLVKDFWDRILLSPRTENEIFPFDIYFLETQIVQVDASTGEAYLDPEGRHSSEFGFGPRWGVEEGEEDGEW